MPPTPILKAELHIAGVRVFCDKTELRFIQPTDHMGRPNAGVKLTLLEITLSGPAAFLPIWQQLQLNVFRRESGLLVWRTEQGQSVRRLTFFNAPCVALAFQLDAKGQGQEAASGLRLRFSPAAVQLDGVFVELYSRLHWEKDAAIRRRALVNPFLLPQLVPPPVAPPRLVPPGLPSLPPVAPLVGAAVGLAALLLTPANDADAPGYDAEKAFGRLNSPLLSDAQRLAFLERELAHRPLNPQEQAQYENLLAKVKGIHGELPKGFPNRQIFDDIGADLKQALDASGIKYKSIGVRGSSVTDVSSKGGAFRLDEQNGLPPSDLDVFIDLAEDVPLNSSQRIPGLIHPDRVFKKYPLLEDWSVKWTGKLGRDITPGMFKPGQFNDKKIVKFK